MLNLNMAKSKDDGNVLSHRVRDHCALKAYWSYYDSSSQVCKDLRTQTIKFSTWRVNMTVAVHTVSYFKFQLH